MENRRRRSREQQMLLSQKRAKLGVGAGERPRIADQFIDLKRELVHAIVFAMSACAKTILHTFYCVNVYLCIHFFIIV